MRTVSVIGASSFVGAHLCRYLRAHAADRLRVHGTTCSRAPGPGETRLDVTDPAALAAHLAADFDFVLLVAGTKDVKRCEADPEHALALNARPAEAAARIVRERGLRTRLVYLSSDYVFDGQRGGYRDDETPSPTTAYGRSKARGEEAVLAAGGGHKVVRSAAVLGRGGTFFDWLVARLRESGELRLFSDAFNSPTPADLLSALLLELLDGWDGIAAPVLHLVGERRMSRHELGALVASLIPGCPARLVPEPLPRSGALLQRDLSMVPSALVVRRPRPALDELLVPEVCGC